MSDAENTTVESAHPLPDPDDTVDGSTLGEDDVVDTKPAPSRSGKFNVEDIPDLSQLLPDPEETMIPIKVISFSNAVLEGDVVDSGAAPPCSVRIHLKTDKESDLLSWKKAFCDLTNTDYIVKAVSRATGSRLSVSKLYVCQLSSKRKAASSTRSMGCKASLHLKIRRPPLGVVNKEKKEGYYAEIDIHWHHTHGIISPQVLSRLRVPSHLKDRAFGLFSQGFSPANVKQIVKMDVFDGDHMHLHNKHMNPSYSQLRWLYTLWRREQGEAGQTKTQPFCGAAFQKRKKELLDQAGLDLNKESLRAKVALSLLLERMQADLRAAVEDTDQLIEAARTLYKNKASMRKKSSSDIILALYSQTSSLCNEAPKKSTSSSSWSHSEHEPSAPPVNTQVTTQNNYNSSTFNTSETLAINMLCGYNQGYSVPLQQANVYPPVHNHNSTFSYS